MSERLGEGKAGDTLLALGFGYVAQALGRRLAAQGVQVLGTNRAGRDGALAFDGTIGPALEAAAASATVVLISIPPDADGCPAARAFATDPAKLPAARWIGYLSTTGVYGDLGGRWAFEWSPRAPTSDIAARRVRAEDQWLARGAHVFRLPGIYGPGRSAFDRLRAGDAQRIVKPGQVFSRAHVEDIAAALAASIARPNPGRAYNVCDDEPAPPQDVITHAAQMLGVTPPPEIAYDKADLSPMARRFYQDSKRVANARLKAELGWRPAFPSYREGLAAILDAEHGAESRR
ncbi:MAG: SDR family NAD(P)-dependent oxidoreductase [Alphaproteobacteria bacterium]|nr:SDR family NAD(P)-dependent oxidoreductase [Alphaproteobacteria bacterium]